MRIKKIVLALLSCTFLLGVTMQINASRGRKRKNKLKPAQNHAQQNQVVYPSVPETILYDQNPTFNQQPAMNPNYVAPEVQNDIEYANRILREQQRQAETRRIQEEQDAEYARRIEREEQRLKSKYVPNTNPAYRQQSQQRNTVVEPPVVVNVNIGREQPRQFEPPVYFIGDDEPRQPRIQRPAPQKSILTKNDIETIQFNVCEGRKKIHVIRKFRKESKLRLERADFPNVHAATMLYLASLERENGKIVDKEINSINYIQKTKTLIINVSEEKKEEIIERCINQKTEESNDAFRFRLSSFPSSPLGDKYLKFLRANEVAISTPEIPHEKNIKEIMINYSQRKQVSFVHNYKKDSLSRLERADYKNIFPRLMHYLQSLDNQEREEKGISIHFDIPTKTLLINTTKKQTKDELTQYVVNNKQSNRGNDTEAGICIIL